MKDLKSVEERHQKPGGNFWLVLVHDPVTKKKIIAGQLGLVLADEDATNDQVPQDLKIKKGRIEMVGVSAPYRKFGIAKKLVEAAIKFAKEEKFDCLSLEVSEVNARAISLYEKCGFKKTRILVVSKWTGLKDVIMILNFKEK